MEQNNPTGDFSEDKKVIMQALARVEEEAEKRRLEQEQEFPEEDIDIPEDLSEPGEHTLSDMASLARIGKGTRTFDFQGNTIQVKTLSQGEELEILSRVNAFPQSAQALAYNTYVAAMSLENVNGKPYFDRMPIGKNQDIINYRFRKAQELYPETINAIVNNVFDLRRELNQKARYAKKG